MAIRSLYDRLMAGWNGRNAAEMAAPFAEDGELIGYDGSQVTAKKEIEAHVGEVFAHHMTPPYITQVKSVRLLGADAAILRAIAGMIPPGQTELEPKLNAWHTLVAVKQGGEWQIALFQNTPAQFHGRPDLVQAMTDELRTQIGRVIRGH
jgi:uncharacterized protein (TIGR02246 family)